MVQYGWTFEDALRVIPDGILDEAVGLIIRNVRSKRKAMVPLPSYNAVNTADVQQVTASRCANFTSRLVGDRLAGLAVRMGFHGYTLRVSPLDVQMVQRGASVVPALQAIATERGTSLFETHAFVLTRCLRRTFYDLIFDVCLVP
jgi:hypothetical protein